MKRGTIPRALCWLLLAACFAGLKPLAALLPSDPSAMVREDYKSWSGVLRIWVSEGWLCGRGTFVSWLNKCASAFERKHPGVYLQIEGVSPDQLSSFARADPRPDGILFAPGMVKDACGLVPLARTSGLRPELISAGEWENKTYALPVAMGGYAWALNQALLSRVPLDWSQEKEIPPLGKQPRYLMQAPADEAYRCWSGAVEALCAPRRIQFQEGAPLAPETQVDLGLDPLTPTPAPRQETRLVICRLPGLLPQDFAASHQAFTGFTQGLYAAIPVTQREIRRLQQLSDQGRAPDWTVEGGAAPFTDQLLYMAIPQDKKNRAAARQGLTEQFLSYLISRDGQRALEDVGALCVIPGETLYQGDPGMEQLEKFYQQPLRPARAFDDGFRAQGQAALNGLIRESRSGASP